jgi:nitroimidazol reductase NimA-like FMN-containing flavoprotein (pyridoxamine 5'-phosphate oxidase superfamily)
MDEASRLEILELLHSHDICSLATIRDDGYPQATTVAYVNDGMTLYFCCDPISQKLHNIRHCNKVSLTINRDYSDWNQIRGLSLAGQASEVLLDDEKKHVFKLMQAKFPSITDMDDPAETTKSLAMVRIVPKVFSVLDYRKGYGHT